MYATVEACVSVSCKRSCAERSLCLAKARQAAGAGLPSCVDAYPLHIPTCPSKGELCLLKCPRAVHTCVGCDQNYPCCKLSRRKEAATHVPEHQLARHPMMLAAIAQSLSSLEDAQAIAHCQHQQLLRQGGQPRPESGDISAGLSHRLLNCPLWQPVRPHWWCLHCRHTSSCSPGGG